MSFVSFRRCKVTAIFSRFQEISQILLQLVWTNAQSLDKSRKLTKKLSNMSAIWYQSCLKTYQSCLKLQKKCLNFWSLGIFLYICNIF